MDEDPVKAQDRRVAHARESSQAMGRLYRRERRETALTKSEQMAKVLKTGTTPELVLRRALWAQGLRFRVKNRLPGTPDLFFAGARVAVFVDGCFWHGCPQHGSVPSSNRAYWVPKLERNKERDERATSALQDEGWGVLRFWEHEVAGSLDAVVRLVRQAVVGGAGSECDRQKCVPVPGGRRSRLPESER